MSRTGEVAGAVLGGIAGQVAGGSKVGLVGGVIGAKAADAITPNRVSGSNGCLRAGAL